MPVEGMQESRIYCISSEKPFIIESWKSSVVEGAANVVDILKGEKSLSSSDVGSPSGGPGLGSSGVEVDSKSLENSFSSRSQNETIHEGKMDPEGGLLSSDISEDPEGGLLSSDISESQNGGNSLKSSEGEGISGKLDCEPRDREIVKGITHSGSCKDKNNSGKPSDSATRSGEVNLTSSSEAGASVEDRSKDEVTKKGEFESDGKSFEDKCFGDGSSKDREFQRRLLGKESGETNGELSEKLCVREPEDKKVFEGRASAGYDVNGNPPENSSDVGGASFDTSQAGGFLEDKLHEVHWNGETTHRTSDTGVSFDGKFSEKSFGSASRHEEHHHRHSRGSGAGMSNPALVERLYNPPHICNHVRCAANNPDYATKQAVPPKKYLVAKRHPYGGVIDTARRTSCDNDGGSTDKSRRASCDHDAGSREKTRRTSCDLDGGSSEKSRRTSGLHDKRYVLHALTYSGLKGDKTRRASAESDKSRAISTSAGKSRRTSVDSDPNHALSSSGAPHHKRGKSTPPVGFSHQGPWNSSVALDKKYGDHGFWSSTILEKKYGDHGGWNSSVAVDKKHGDYYYGPWNGSVAIEKKIGERKAKSRSNLPASAKHSSKCDLLDSSRRTSIESSITEDRRQKPRTSSVASEVAEAIETSSSRAERPNGGASANVSGLSEEGRSPPGNSTQEDGSPSVSVGSNHTDQSCSKGAVSWHRSQNSPESSCVTSGDSPSCESLSSVTRGPDSKPAYRARYELPKLPKLSSASSFQSLSESTSGTSAPSKPSWNSSTSKVPLISATPHTVASVAKTSTLAKTFITKLKESTKTAAVVKAPNLPSWNSSITVASNLFDYSASASGVSKMAKKTEAKQRSITRKGFGGEEQIKGQVDGKSKIDNSTTPEAILLSKETVATGPTVLKEMVVPIPESSAEKHVDPGSVVSIPSTPTSKLMRYGSMRDSATNIPTPNRLSKTVSMKEKEIKVPGTVKFGKRGRTTWSEEMRRKETVNLKKGETAERRLSEEYMTDHTLTTTIPRDIQGGRVKSLVHAFESLKTGPDTEHHHSADETVRSEHERELAAIPPSHSPIPV